MSVKMFLQNIKFTIDIQLVFCDNNSVAIDWSDLHEWIFILPFSIWVYPECRCKDSEDYPRRSFSMGERL
jgi:hypothetical protein